jgi:hypothetical protein
MVGTEVCTSVNTTSCPASCLWDGGENVGDGERNSPIYTGTKLENILGRGQAADA